MNHLQSDSHATKRVKGWIRQPLCAELRAAAAGLSCLKLPACSVNTRQLIQKFGGASRDRTDDLIVANDALSQLSYSPVQVGIDDSVILSAFRNPHQAFALVEAPIRLPL